MFHRASGEDTVAMNRENASVEVAIDALLKQTRAENEHYSSAHYRLPNQPGQTGLGNRLDAIEEALLILARSVDDALRDK